MVDDSHRDVSINTMKRGIEFPLSTMPGEKVDHVYAGPMEAETIHFLDCVARASSRLSRPSTLAWSCRSIRPRTVGRGKSSH